MLRHRRLSLALAALLCALAVAGQGMATPAPVRAAVPMDSPEFKDLHDFLQTLGFTDDAIAQIAANTDPDKLSDWFDPQLKPPPIKPATSDITETSFFEIHTTPGLAAGWRAPGGPLDCKTAGAICPRMPANGTWGPNFVVYAVTTVATPVPFKAGRIELGGALLFSKPGGGAPPAWKAFAQFPGDFFDGFNEAYTFRSEAGGPFQAIKLVNDPVAKSFVERPTDAYGTLQGRTLIGIIPETDTGTLVSGRFFAFTGSSAGLASDTFPDITLPGLAYTGIPTLDLGLAAASPSASATPAETPAQTSAASAAASPSASPTPGSTASTSGGFPWPLVIAIGALLALIGGFLLQRGSRGGNATTGGLVGVAVGVVSDDPCPPLIAAARAAQAACDEAMRAAAAAADAAGARAAEAAAARTALGKARSAREAAEKELERRRQPPDPGARLGSTSYGGRDVHVDAYDLSLQAQARAAANAAHDAAVGAATDDAERQQANDDWVNELQRIDGPAGLDEVRTRDKVGRDGWIKEAEASLKAAQEAEATAQSEATRTADAANAADAGAAAAKQRADAACARAAEAAAAAADCIQLQTPAVPAAGATPPVPPVPPVPPTPPTPPNPPTPPIPPTPSTPPTPATPQTSSRPCPDGVEPRVTTSGALEVDLFVLAGAQLKIDGAFLFGDAEAQAAIDGLETASTASDIAVGLIGAVTDPVGSILGTIGVPSFDTVTSAPTGAAMQALNKLREQLKDKRKIGTWHLSVPKQRYRFTCRTTESCVGGTWVVTGRDFVAERVGGPSFVDSAPYELVDMRETDRAWTMMSTSFIRQNQPAEVKIAAAAKACGG